MSAGLSRGLRKGGRTILQMLAGGALTALVNLLANGLSPSAAGSIMVLWSTIVAFTQNWLEGSGKIPVLLPTPSLIPTPPVSRPESTPVVAPPAAGTIAATVDNTGKVTGEVSDLAGDTVGTIETNLPVEPGEEGH